MRYMGLIEGELDFRVCTLDQNGNLQLVVARATNFTIAIAACEAALEVYPRDGVAVLLRARLLRQRDAIPLHSCQSGERSG